MDLTLCSASAFNFYRVPPQILGLYPPLPGAFEDSNHLKRVNSPLVSDLLKAPIDRITPNSERSGSSKLYRSHSMTNDLPFGSVCDTEHGFRVTSPQATLLTMASGISQAHLLMAVYEMTGAFAVFSPPAHAEHLLEQAIVQQFIRPHEGWQRVMNVDGHSTSLWKRSPLTTREELETFCQQVDGFHGVKKLRWAAEHVTGETASPFEVQTSMLLGLPRAAGGEGLAIKNNQRIPLSPAARTICRQDTCYADILIEGNGDDAGVIIECQGRSAHASEAASISDSNRTTALTSMGYEVILLTHEQITNPRAFHAVLDIIARKTGIKRRPKTERQLKAESKLRSELFIDWATLGS